MQRVPGLVFMFYFCYTNFCSKVAQESRPQGKQRVPAARSRSVEDVAATKTQTANLSELNEKVSENCVCGYHKLNAVHKANPEPGTMKSVAT